MSKNLNNRILDLIRSKISLSEIVGKDIVLKKKGREHVGNCPFHSEKTGSFFVNNEKGKYYCFGCGAHGDIFSYIMNSKGYSFKQALDLLAGIANVKLPTYEIKQKDNKQSKQMQVFLNLFKTELQKNKLALEYCEKRGIDNNIIEKFSIGYCPITNIHSDIHIFRGRLIFPIFSNSGLNVIAFGGRSIIKNVQPKYINSNESEIFQKKEILYGYHIASQNVTKDKPYIVVEGYMDVIIMYKFGFDTTVGSMGTSFTSAQLLMIWRYSDEPILCFDGDNAGKKAMVRASLMALEYISPGKTLRFCNLPTQKDPDSYLNENSAESMKRLLKKSDYLIDFIWNSFQNEYFDLSNKAPEHIAKWKKSCLDKLSIINNEELKKMYIFDIKERMYNLLRPNSPKKNNAKPHLTIIDKRNKKILREAVLLYTLLKRHSVVPHIFEKMAFLTFSTPSFETIAKHILLDEYDQISAEEINNIEKLAKSYFPIDNITSDEEVISFWNEVFSNHVFQKETENDLQIAKKECKAEFSTDNWERLKALKINSLKERNKYDKQ